MPFRDQFDIAWSYIVDDGHEIHARVAVRSYLRTGKVQTADGEDVDPERAADMTRQRRDVIRSAAYDRQPRAPEQVKNIDVGNGVLVSQDDIDFFGEMGGEFTRRNRAARIRQQQMDAERAAQAEPEKVP